MKKAAIFIYERFQHNKLFDRHYWRDNWKYHWHLLKEEWKKEGFDLNTQDIYPLEDCDFIIFFDFPTFQENVLKKLYDLKKTIYLLCFETDMIIPQNFEKANHKYFKQIFTMLDKWVDNKKFIKYYYPNKIPEDLNFSIKKKDKFCTLIASRKYIFDKRELCTERIKAILWFEKNHPNEFDLYGRQWHKGIWKPFILPFIHSKNFQQAEKFTIWLKISKKLFNKKLKSYKGEVKSKKETYSRYKFAICYENAKNISGYITEKIFDCFFGGCIPIYLGAPNIANYIPKNTFIDKNSFKTYRKLYKFLKNMDNETYSQYLENIKTFLKSEKMFYFSAENFVITLTNTILRNH